MRFLLVLDLIALKLVYLESGKKRSTEVETYLEKSSRRSGSGDAKRGTNIISSIVLLNIFNLEGSFRCNMEMTAVSIIRKH